jgi:hypothetical protein
MMPHNFLFREIPHGEDALEDGVDALKSLLRIFPAFLSANSVVPPSYYDDGTKCHNCAVQMPLPIRASQVLDQRANPRKVTAAGFLLRNNDHTAVARVGAGRLACAKVTEFCDDGGEVEEVVDVGIGFVDMKHVGGTDFGEGILRSAGEGRSVLVGHGLDGFLECVEILRPWAAEGRHLVSSVLAFMRSVSVGFRLLGNLGRVNGRWWWR